MVSIIPLISIALMSSQTVTGNSSGAEVTVYNGGYSFVKEVRTINLKLGTQQIRIADVPSTIDPTSVAIDDLTQANGFDVLEQNYQYDLISPDAILRKAIGEKVTLIQNIDGKSSKIIGTMLSAPTSVTTSSGVGQTYVGMVLQLNDGQILLNPAGELIVNSIPDGLISKPTLVWDLESHETGPVQAQISFLANQMDWHADYVFTISRTQNIGSINGWVTVQNSCGVSFKDAKLNLLAGDVNRVSPQPKMQFSEAKAYGGNTAAPQFQQQQMFEYHLYKLQRPTTIANNETKQISLLSADGVNYTKELVFNNWIQIGAEGGPQDNLSPDVHLIFKNSEKNHLGMPLPEGKFRIYQQDSSGDAQFIGEDSILHTPKNEDVNLTIGKSFDVRATRTQEAFSQKGSNTYSVSYAMKVRNHHDSAETVIVKENCPGSFVVDQSSDPYTKTSSSQFEFKVTIPANGVKVISYKATIKI